MSKPRELLVNPANESCAEEVRVPIAKDVKVYSVSETAALLGLSERTIRRYLENGRIPKRQNGFGGLILISGYDINSYFENLKR